MSIFEFLQIHSEIMAEKGSVKGDQHNVHTMPLLLATVYESARLLQAAPLLQRCSQEHGEKSFASLAKA